MTQEALPAWRGRDGALLECTEKLRVLAENETELKQALQDVWEEALVMGVAPETMRARLEALLNALVLSSS